MKNSESINDIISKVKTNRIVYTGQILVCVSDGGAYVVIGLERKNPTIIEIQYQSHEELSFIGEKIDDDCYLISGHDIYDIIEIIGEFSDTGKIHIDYICTNKEDSRTIGYVLSELSAYAALVIHSDVEPNKIKYLIEILNVVKEESSLIKSIEQILFYIRPICESYTDILSIYSQILNSDLKIFDKNTRFDLICGSDSNSWMMLNFLSSQPVIQEKGGFKNSRGIVIPQSAW